MQVYIEYIFVNNLFVNYFIMWLAIDTLRAKFCWWRVAISSIIGALFVCFLTKFSFLNNILIKLTLALTMVAIMTKHQNLFRYLGGLALFFIYTFMLGGVIQGIFNLSVTDGKFIISNNLKPALLSGGLLLMYILFRMAFVQTTKSKREDKFEQNIILYLNNKSCKCKAFWDSGNKLYYHMTRPVVIIDKSIAIKLVDTNSLQYIEDYIKVETITGEKKLRLFTIDKLEYESPKKNNIFDVCVAISDTPLKNYGALLNCDM